MGNPLCPYPTSSLSAPTSTRSSMTMKKSQFRKNNSMRCVPLVHYAGHALSEEELLALFRVSKDDRAPALSWRFVNAIRDTPPPSGTEDLYHSTYDSNISKPSSQRVWSVAIATATRVPALNGLTILSSCATAVFFEARKMARGQRATQLKNSSTNLQMIGNMSLYPSFLVC